MMKIDIEEIDINLKISQGPEASEKAIVTLSIGPLKIKGLRILPSNFKNKFGDAIWLVPPSYRSKSGKFQRQFHCEDKKLWEEIQDKVFEEYKEKLQKMPPPVIDEKSGGYYRIKKEEDEEENEIDPKKIF